MKVKIENIDCHTSSEVYERIGKIIAAIDKECVDMEIIIDALSAGSITRIICWMDEKPVLKENETIL